MLFVLFFARRPVRIWCFRKTNNTFTASLNLWFCFQNFPTVQRSNFEEVLKLKQWEFDFQYSYVWWNVTVQSLEKILVPIIDYRVWAFLTVLRMISLGTSQQADRVLLTVDVSLLSLLPFCTVCKKVKSTLLRSPSCFQHSNINVWT